MKQKLREEYLNIRNKISDKDLKSVQIIEKLSNEQSFKKAKNLLFYADIKSEVKTINFIEEIITEKNVFLPRINHEDKTMKAISYEFGDELKPGPFGIPQPVEGEETNKEDIDVVIIPAISFDLMGHRIGYGHGYYDKFLKGTNAIKIGLAFDKSITQEIPKEEHDVPVDIVITEKRVIRYGNSKTL